MTTPSTDQNEKLIKAIGAADQIHAHLPPNSLVEIIDGRIVVTLH